VNYTINNGLWWIENLILIPGNVWTSAVSNIGAYWQEARETIYEIVWVNLGTNTIQKISNDDCNFSYRNSIFKNELKDKFIITHVVYKLKKVDWDYEFKTSYKDVTAYFENNNIDFDNLSISEKLPTISKAIEVIRRNKLPDHTKLWTAWSYFKNPEISFPERDDLQTKFPELRAHLTENETMKLSAGQLIELCWWKWKEVNWVKMYEKHALILINSNPSWEVVAEYAQMVQDSVKEKFWVQLEPEVIYCK
jgi:UDP-N-acetylmuramate dehydrogenase